MTETYEDWKYWRNKIREEKAEYYTDTYIIIILLSDRLSRNERVKLNRLLKVLRLDYDCVRKNCLKGEQMNEKT